MLRIVLGGIALGLVLTIFFINNTTTIESVPISLQITKLYEESYDQITETVFSKFDSLFEIAGVRDNPFGMVIYLITYFSQFHKGRVKKSDREFFNLNEILTNRTSNLRSSAVATVAVMQKFNWDVQLFYNEQECYLGLNLSEDWIVRKGTWIEKEGKKYYLKEYDTKTPVGKLNYDNPGSFYQSIKLPQKDSKPIPLIKSLPQFPEQVLYKKQLKWSFKNKEYLLQVEIPVQLAEWTANLPPSLYGMVSSGVEEFKRLWFTERLKFLSADFDEFEKVNFLLKFCQSPDIFIYDRKMPIKSVTNQLIDGRNDCDGRSVFLFCLLLSVLEYPDSNIVFLSWPNHIALGLKPKTQNALLKLKEAGFYVGDNYFILDPAYHGDTEWGSRMKVLTGECEIIKVDSPFR